MAQRGDRPVALVSAAVTSRSFFQQWNICSTNAISMQELSVQFTQGSVQSPINKDLRWALFFKHCWKKIRNKGVISRSLQRSGLLFVPNFEFLAGQRKMLHACHYNLQFVYFLPHFWMPKMLFEGAFFVKFRPHVRLVFKSGFKSRAGYSGAGTCGRIRTFFPFFDLQFFASPNLHFAHTANFIQRNFYTF